MKFHTLAIQNFLTVGHATVELADKGLHLIQGENADNSSATSNGAGKSSIVDAISWVLFGVTARGLKGDKVVNNKKKKDCAVSLTVSNGATTYDITRFRKHATGKNSLRVMADTTAGPVDMTKGTDAETQKVVEQILGCSWEVFRAAVYSAQEEMPDLPRKTDKELKTLIEEAAGMQRIERAYELARERKNAASTALQLAENTVTVTQANLARTEQQLDAAGNERDAWETARADRVSAAQKQADDGTNLLRHQLSQLVARKSAYDAAVAERTQIDQQLAEHSTLEKAALTAEREFNRLNLAVDRAGLAAAQKKVESFDYAIANVDQAMAIPCDHCGKPHTPEERDSYLAHQKELRDKANQALTDKKAAVVTQVKAAAAAKTAAEAARATVPDVTATTARRKELSDLIRNYDSDKLTAQRQKDQLDALKKAVTDRQTELNPHDKLVANLQGTLQTLHAEVAAQVVMRNAAKAKLQTLEDVCRVFGPAGVRAQILDTVTPFLNERTADYLSVLSDGTIKAVWTTLSKAASGDLKEKFSIEVEDSQGGDSFDALSGGEKRKVRIACALALQDLVASRAMQPIDLFIADEVDDALDPAGLERLMAVFERKARERGTVIVISHNDIRDWIDEVTIVRKQGGVSIVEGSLCS